MPRLKNFGRLSTPRSRNFGRQITDAKTVIRLLLVIILFKIILKAAENIGGDFLTGETLYRSMGRFYFSRGDFVSIQSLRWETLLRLRGDSVSGETLFRDTGQKYRRRTRLIDSNNPGRGR